MLEIKQAPICPASTILCVDLDGTLVETDTLWESLVQVLFKKPLALFPIVWSLRKGKAQFKAALARHVSLKASSLPYRRDLLVWLQQQQSAGRRIVLTTAAHQSIADAVARHLGVFEAALGSTADLNLSGSAKGKALASLAGEDGFSYAGNSETDLSVWGYAAWAVPVNAPSKVVRRIGARIENTFPAHLRNPLHTIRRALRMHQWTKNLLVLVPVITSGAFLDINSVAMGLMAVLALSMTASAQYLLNDLLDLESDRQHDSKRYRAIASGALSIPAAFALIPLLLLGTALVAWLANSPMMLLLCAGYFIASLLYSLSLKQLPLVDVFTLAGLFTYRVVMGGQITGHPVTNWLLTFSFLWFLSLGFLKRFIEVIHAEDAGKTVGRRAYRAGESTLLMAMGQGSGFSSTIMLALYVNSEAANRVYSRPSALWIFVPISLLVHCRLWLSGSRRCIEEDPVRYIITDRVMWACLALGAAAYCLAIGRSS